MSDILSELEINDLLDTLVDHEDEGIKKPEKDYSDPRFTLSQQEIDLVVSTLTKARALNRNCSGCCDNNNRSYQEGWNDACKYIAELVLKLGKHSTS